MGLSKGLYDVRLWIHRLGFGVGSLGFRIKVWGFGVYIIPNTSFAEPSHGQIRFGTEQGCKRVGVALTKPEQYASQYGGNLRTLVMYRVSGLPKL